MNEGITTLQDLLVWLAGPGAFVAVSWATAWLLEDVAWWQNLTGKLRSVITLAGSLVIGIVAIIVLGNEEIVAALSPYFAAIIAIVGTWIVTQTAHKLDPKRKDN